MKKKITIVLAALMLLTALAGCAKEKEVEFPWEKIEIIEYSNAHVSFLYPSNYHVFSEDIIEGKGELHHDFTGFGTVEFQRVPHSTSFDLEKHTLDFVDRVLIGQRLSNPIHVKTEDLVVSGKPSKLIEFEMTFTKDPSYISYVISLVDSEYFYVFDFHFNKDETNDQFVKDLMSTVKFK